jgi:predicted ATPase
MIRKIAIQNYKSIEKLSFELGRVNVIIGENGAGKSNILEAIALAGAASAGKLDNEFLASRGIRVTQPALMRPAFDATRDSQPIDISVTSSDAPGPVNFSLINDNAPYSQWRCVFRNTREEALSISEFIEIAQPIATSGDKKITEAYADVLQKIADELATVLKTTKITGDAKSDSRKVTTDSTHTISFALDDDHPFIASLTQRKVSKHSATKHLKDFVIYSPENSALKLFEKEGQIEPLGINGEGILKLLHVLSETSPEALLQVKSSLRLLGWFEDFDLVDDQSLPSRMEIKDRYLYQDKRYYDQRSVNEGFLFLAFYFSLFSTSLTPPFFAVDNIDASLNPKLCEKLMRQLIGLAEQNGKQVILTTHNPAILDGLNLDDDEQRLFVVSRTSSGQTKLRRIQKKSSSESSTSVRLSEAFLRGSIGGIPKGF